jgi:hydroxymethylpyrimidine pyrophosphatase-like HAD family hydrolase
MQQAKIVAFDFDGTVAVDNYQNIGEPIVETIEMLKAEKKRGSKLILWTNRTNDDLDAAVSWCHEQGIEFDEVNNNLPEIILAFKCNPRKVFANEYWDDRAVFLPHLKRPKR